MNWNNKKLWKVSGITAVMAALGALAVYDWMASIVVAAMGLFFSLGFFIDPPKR